MSVWSVGQEKLLDELPKHPTLKEACIALGWSPNYGGWVASTIRLKIGKSEDVLKDVRRRMRNDRLTNKILTRRK